MSTPFSLEYHFVGSGEMSDVERAKETLSSSLRHISGLGNLLSLVAGAEPASRLAAMIDTGAAEITFTAVGELLHLLADNGVEALTTLQDALAGQKGGG